MESSIATQPPTVTFQPVTGPLPNEEQQAAIDAMLAFVSDPDPISPFFVLSGYAGTGKTFCMRALVSKTRQSRIKFAFTAPTNKAAKVLRRITGEASTIYSLLGLRIDKSGELKELVVGQMPPDLSEIDVIVIDEAGMVNKNLMGILREKVEPMQGSLKVIFMGDEAQLPPVGEATSPIWKEPNATVSKLFRVMRHDNQILTLVTSIRESVFHFSPNITIKSDNDGQQGVWKVTKSKFKDLIYDAGIKGEFADGALTKVIAWRNIRVGEYNSLIRSGIFGVDARPGWYLPGDRVIAAGPCKQGEDMILGTDDEALVESVKEGVHPMESAYKILELRCRTETNITIRLTVLHPDSAEKFASDCAKLAHEARGNGKLWKKFWNLKDLFHEVKYAYAITAHRAQGSTYTKVFVDYQDILLNRDRTEAFKCLYTATSRPTTQLYLA